MSFSKAQIKRFNELTSEAPPPGAYDPKFDTKVKTTIMQEKKTGRYASDARSTTSSGAECNASVSSRANSHASAKQFRTPQVPKKRIIVKPTGMSCPRIKTKLYKENKDPLAPYEPQHELADLKVELANKDRTIQEYERHMDEMKAELAAVADKYEALQKRHSRVDEQHQKDIEAMAKLQQEVMGNKSEKYRAEMESLREELEAALKAKDEELARRVEVEKTLNDRIKSLEDELESDEIVARMKNLEVATQKLGEMTDEMNKVLSLKDSEVKDMASMQAEMEKKLDVVQSELEKSEQRVADLEARSLLNQRLLDDAISVLQEYFDDGKWNIDNFTFPEQIQDFLKKIRKLVADLRLTYEREMELSRDNFNEERENLEQELEQKRCLILELESKLAETNETNNFLTEELQDVQKLYKDMCRSVHEIKAELEVSNERYAKAVAAHKSELELTNKIHLEQQTKLKDLLEEARSEYLKELDNMTTARNEELSEVKQAMEKRIEDEKKRMKECANKMIENAETVTRDTLKACRAESEEKVRRVIADTDAKIAAMAREAKNATEEELRQATEKFNACLDRIESEKATLNATLAQRDLEIIRLTAALDEIKCTAETQESFSQSLQAELDRAEAELVEKKDELRNLKDQIRTESAEMVARRRRFEVVMAENQASVGALTRRLAQSEAEVDRLQRELQTKEGCLLGYRELLETLTLNSKMVQEQLETISGKIEEKEEIISQLEVESVNEINEAKTIFNDKIDDLKNITISELVKSQHECKEKTERNEELKSNLHQMSNKLSDAKEMLLKLEELNDEQSIEMSKLQLQNTKLQHQLDEKSRIAEENKLAFDIELQQYKHEIIELNEKLTRLKDEMKDLEEKKNLAEEKIYDYEELKLKYSDEVLTLTQKLQSEEKEREELKKQIKKYEQTCERLTEECKRIQNKYAEAIGHENHKQRIKHVSQLKEKINTQQIDLLRLRQELDTKSNLVEELRKANEKLKLEDWRQAGIGKENVHSLSSPHKTLFPKSANTTPCSSPHKPLTPLRDRND